MFAYIVHRYINKSPYSITTDSLYVTIPNVQKFNHKQSATLEEKTHTYPWIKADQ